MKAVGFDVRQQYSQEVIGRRDVLVIWNRYGHFHSLAERFEAAGATVVVAENGYIGADENGRQLYALAIGRHNGFGLFTVGDADRWSALNIEIAPWRQTRGDYILVCLQRGIGAPPICSPSPADMATIATRAITPHAGGMPILFRRHPEDRSSSDPVRPIEDELRDAHACVIWTSTAGVKALIAGVPVFYLAERWICESASSRDLSMIRNPPRPDRLQALRRMAWAQWTLSEIEQGTPFRSLCT